MLTSSLSGEAVVVEDAEEAEGVEIQALRKNWRLTSQVARLKPESRQGSESARDRATAS